MNIKEIFDFIENCDGECSGRNGEHGALVDYRFEAYCDVFVYEDGYEERFYIGE